MNTAKRVLKMGNRSEQDKVLFHSSTASAVDFNDQDMTFTFEDGSQIRLENGELFEIMESCNNQTANKKVLSMNTLTQNAHTFTQWLSMGRMAQFLADCSAVEVPFSSWHDGPMMRTNRRINIENAPVGITHYIDRGGLVPCEAERCLSASEIEAALHATNAAAELFQIYEIDSYGETLWSYRYNKTQGRWELE